jgi:hypothetical protein
MFLWKGMMIETGTAASQEQHYNFPWSEFAALCRPGTARGVCTVGLGAPIRVPIRGFHY